MNQHPKNRLDMLLGFLGQDPDNPNLLADAIEAAFAASDLGQARNLVDRLGDLRPGSFEAGYFSATLAMIERDFERACDLLDPLVDAGAPPNARFNLAWSKAMVGVKDRALELLDADTTSTIPAAAMLRTQLLHEGERFEEAMEFGKSALALFPDDAGLNSALATLALDLEDNDLARACSARGGDHPEALAVSGMLEMLDGDPGTALATFERSLAIRQHNPRAWIGLGLAKLAGQDAPGAASDLDRGAQQFGDQIGSWISAGWAHYLSGDIDAASQRFERALAIDHNFAESHGSLAVIEAARGNNDNARRLMETAFRLNRQCFSAVLAKVMLDAANPEEAQALLERAFNTPLNDQGMTITSYMAGMVRPTLH